PATKSRILRSVEELAVEHRTTVGSLRRRVVVAARCMICNFSGGTGFSSHIRKLDRRPDDAGCLPDVETPTICNTPSSQCPFAGQPCKFAWNSPSSACLGFDWSPQKTMG